MKFFSFLPILFLTLTCFSNEVTHVNFDIKIKNSVNLRTSPNFVGQENLAGGMIHKGAVVKVINEVTLPSGNKAYEINLDTVEPKNLLRVSTGRQTLWIYGSHHFAEKDERAQTEAQAPEVPCKDCQPPSQIGKALIPIREQARQEEARQAATLNSSEISDDAKNMVESLTKKNPPFKCDLRPSEINLRGIQCVGRVTQYPQPVRIYIPKNYVKSDKNTAHFFFHGFKQVPYQGGFVNNDPFKVNSNDGNGPGDFGARLAESGSNSGILVIPEDAGRNQTYRNFFQDGKGNNFEFFKKQIEFVTSTSEFPKITLAGHSAGNVPVALLLSYSAINSKVKNAALFEGTYDTSLPITDWLNTHPDAKLRLSSLKNRVPGDNQLPASQFLAKVKNKAQVTPFVDENSYPGTFASHMDNIRKGGYSDFLKD